MHDYFPSKLALGDQFCNRVDEKRFIEENVEKGRHTVLNAPRRYGKSSLVVNGISELNIPLAFIDLFLAHDDSAVTRRILVGISQAVSQIMPINQKILGKLHDIFSKFRVSISTQGFSIDASHETIGLDPVDQIYSGLHALALLVKDQKKKIVFFIDEFQDIIAARSAKSIQGAIRHVAQETSNLVFIFSGSNRRLLLELFDDKSMPLYMLCDIMKLDRISSTSYRPHLQKLAKKKWKKALSLEVFERIMSLSELHPYYVNLLCNEVWKLKKNPTSEDVFECWQRCYENQEPRLIAELEKLTSKQQDVLKALAIHPAVEPSGHDFMRVVKMPTSSVISSIKVLLEKDMLYKVGRTDDVLPQLELNQIRVLDPLLAYVLKKFV